MDISPLTIVAAALLAIIGAGLFILVTRGAWVPRPLARYYAYKSLSQFVVVEDGLPGSTEDYDNDWGIDNFSSVFAAGQRGTVRSLYDVKGRVVFYDLTVSGIGQNRQLRVRAAANFALGAPIVSAGVNAPLPIEEWIGSARAIAKTKDLTPIDEGRDYPEDQNPAIVCYSYPLLGLLCRCKKTGKRYVIRLDTDPHDVDNVDKGVQDADAESKSVKDGGHMVSSPLDFPNHWSAPRNLLRHAGKAYVLAAIPSLKKLKRKRPRPPRDLKILDVPMIAQQKFNYCAPATAQMILLHDFKKQGQKFAKSQLDIADAMNVPCNGIDGVDLEDQRRGYAVITENEFSARSDETPTFKEACDEIDDERPLVSRYPGHIRCAIGWARKHPETHMVGEFLLINDPSPMNVGDVCWEDWMGPDPNKQVSHYFYVTPERHRPARD